jgi:hypothetical protein
MTTPHDPEWDDPIVAEVRAVRERILQESGGTLEGLIARLQTQEASRRNVVTGRAKTQSSDSDVA